MILEMDLGATVTVVTIALSVVGLVLAFLKYFKNGDYTMSKNNGIVSFSYLKDKLKDFVTKDSCTSTKEGFEKMLEAHQNSYREELRLTTTAIRHEIQALMPGIRTTIKEEIKNNNKSRGLSGEVRRVQET